METKNTYQVMKNKYSLSIVIPIYNEEETLPELFLRLEGLSKLLEIKCKLSADQVEVLFVNDGSKDKSLPILIQYCQTHRHYKLINLSRNHGHQLAITAGLDLADGGAVVVMDGDLQDPPEFICDLYNKLNEGFDVVYAQRKKRVGESFFKLVTAKVFYRLLKKMTKFEIPIDTGDFRIMSRRVVLELRKLRETHRYIRGLISWIGFRQIGLEYERQERFKGSTKFNVSKMLRFAFDGITAFSAVPLRLSSYLGFGSAFVGLLYSIRVLYLKYFTNETITGWSSIVIVVLFLGGTQLISLGLIGEYLSRVHEQTKNRPLYVIENIYQKLK